MARAQGRNRKVFLRGQSHFALFFSPAWNAFFVENYHFGRPKTNFSGFQKWQTNKQRKKVLSSFCNFSTFYFPFFTVPFTVFLLFFSIFNPFPFFLASFFPVGQQKFPGQKSRGHFAPCSPPPVTPLPVLHPWLYQTSDLDLIKVSIICQECKNDVDRVFNISPCLLNLIEFSFFSHLPDIGHKNCTSKICIHTITNENNRKYTPEVSGTLFSTQNLL